ncbi:MAG: substrate-binding domain-containing protein, partial [Pseudomonadota bacterium]
GPIQVLSAPKGLNFADNYVDGVLEETEAQGLAEPAIWRGNMTEEDGRAAATDILSRPGPRAFACIQDSFAFGAYRAATDAGMAIGRDLTVFGGQNFPGSEHTAPPLSTFSTKDHHIAELLSRVMLRRLDLGNTRPHGGYEHHEIKPIEVLRRSHIRQ